MNNSTTMLSDSDALKVFQAIPGEQDPAKKAAMVGLLGSYRDAKRAQGVEPFQPSPDEEIARKRRFESLYANLDGVDATLPSEKRTELAAMLQTSANPAEAKARMVNMAYLRETYGVSQVSPAMQGAVQAVGQGFEKMGAAASLLPAGIQAIGAAAGAVQGRMGLLPGWDEANWPAIKRSYAKQALGIDKPEVSDVELFGAIGQKIQKQKAEQAMMGKLVEGVTMAAFDGADNYLDAYAKAAPAIESDPGYSPGSRDRYRAVAKAAFTRMKDRVDQLKPLADRIVVSLAREQGTQEMQGAMGFSVDALVDMVRDVPDEDRPLLYAAVARAAAKSPDAGVSKGVGEQSAEAVGRGIMDVLRSQKAALKENPETINARMLADGADRVTVAGERRAGESLLEWATRSMQGNYGVIDFVKDVATQSGQPSLRNRRPLTEEEQAALKAEVQDMQKTRAIRKELRDIAEGVVDPIKGENFVTEKVLYPFLRTSAYTAQGLIPYAGLPLLISSTVGMRSEEMMARGVPIEQAQKMALASALIEAPVEYLQAKMVIGALPGFKKLLTAPVETFAQLTGRAAAIGGVQIAEQNLQEAFQDATPLVVQEVGSWLSDAIPDVDWRKELAAYGKERVDTFWALLPMVLIGTGSATFSDAAYGRQYFNNKKVLMAVGFTEEAAVQVLEAPTIEEKQALVQEWWKDEEMRQTNSAAQRAAFADMDADMQASFAERGTEGEARVVRLENGEYAVEDAQGELVDVASSPDTAFELLKDLNDATELNSSQVILDVVDYVQRFQEAGQSIELVDAPKRLQDIVDKGDMTQEEAEGIVDLYVRLGRLEAGSSPADIMISGENEVTRYDARRRIVEDVSRIYSTGTPLTVIEEHTEGYLKRRLAAGEVTLEDLIAWRESLGMQGANDERSLIEFFSEQAQAYLVGKMDRSEIPASFRSFMRRLKEYFTKIMELAGRLMKMEADGTLPSDFKTHLARSVGLDEAYVKNLYREQEMAAMQDTGMELSAWIKGRLPHPDDAAAAGEPLAGELRDLFNGMRNRQAAQAFFAKKGATSGRGLDYITQAARQDGFAFETPADLLAALDESMRGIPQFPTYTHEDSRMVGPGGSFSLSRATPADVSNVVEMPDGAQLVGPTTFSIQAFHGTPHKVDKFTTAKIGTGEGAQAYGWGLYFAQAKDVAKLYAEKLSAMKGTLKIDGKDYTGRRQDMGNDVDMLIADAWHDIKHDVKKKSVLVDSLKQRAKQAFKEWKPRFKQAIEKAKSDAVEVIGVEGNLYTVELLPDEADFLDWDAPLSEQSDKVKAALAKIGIRPTAKLSEFGAMARGKFVLGGDDVPTGATVYDAYAHSGAAAAASKKLAAAGIPGIRYLDGGNRGNVTVTYVYGKSHFVVAGPSKTEIVNVGESGREKAKQEADAIAEKMRQEATRNYVIFDENLVKILKENGRPVEGAGTTFSLTDRNTGKLLVVHNTREESIRKFADLGGLAVPSLAVIRPEVSRFTSFGDITLVAGSDIIDPAKSSAAKVFNADIYSPRFPAMRFEVNQKVLDGITKQLRAQSEKLASKGRMVSVELDRDDIERDGLQAVERNTSAQVAWLESKGITPNIVMEQVDPLPDSITAFTGTKWENADNPDFKKAVADYYTAKLGEHRDILESYVDPDTGEAYNTKVIKMAEMLDTFRNPGVDRYATRQAVLNQVEQAGPDEFKGWVRESFSNVISGKRVASYSERTGNTRWLPYNLDNVVQVMKRELRGGEGFSYGVGTIRAQVAVQFRSLKAMREQAGGIVSPGTMQALKAEIDAEFLRLANELSPFYKYEANRFGYLEQVAQSFQELVASPRRWSENFKETPPELMNQVRGFLEKLRNMETEYFEAKVQRGVSLSEFSGAVIPSGTDAEVRDILKNAGLEVVEYERGNVEARAAAISTFGRLTFGMETSRRVQEIRDGMRMRRVAERVAAGEHAGEAFGPAVRKAMESLMYEVEPNKVTVAEALSVINANGVEEAVNIVMSNTSSYPANVKVVMALGLMEHFNKARNYEKAVMVGERYVELGTEHGRAVQAYSMLGRVLDTPEKAQVFLARQVMKAEKAVRERQPAIDAAKDVLVDVQAEALKLLETWLDQINGVASRKASLKPARAEDLPDLTFSLSPRQLKAQEEEAQKQADKARSAKLVEMRRSGIVSTVARMLKESGAVDTRKALVEKYGEKITPFLPDIFIEAQKQILQRAQAGTRAAQGREKKAAERKAKKKQEQEQAEPSRPTEPAATDEQIDATLDAIRQDARKSDVQLDVTVIDEHFRGNRMTPAEIENVLAMARAFGFGNQAQTVFEGIEELIQRFEDEVIARMKVRGLETPQAVRDAVRRLFETKGVNWTPADVKRVFAEKFKVPAATDEQRARLVELAENIRSTPDRSTERTDATVELMNHVNDILKPVDTIDKAWAVWYANVLSGYNTHFRNLLANFMEQTVALPLDAMRANPIVTLQLMREMLFGVRAGVSIGLSEGKRQLQTGDASILQTEANKFGTSGTLERVEFAGGRVNPFNWLKVVGRALRAEDLFAYSTAMEAKARMVAWEMATQKGLEGDALTAEVERLLNATEEQIGDFRERASREWDGLTDELKARTTAQEWQARRVKELRILERDAALIERASEFAARATFNYKPDGMVGIMANSLTDVLARVSGIQATGRLEVLAKALATSPKLVVPFVRIVANVLNRGIDYSGLGVARSISPSKLTGSVTQGVEFKAKSADERAMELKRGIFGIVVLGVLSALADPDDDEATLQIHGSGSGNRDRNLALHGPQWMPYSLEVRGANGSTFISYKQTPLFLGLAVIGGWHDAMRYKKLDEKEQTARLAIAVVGVGHVLLDQSFLASAADALNMFSRDGQVSERAVYSFAGRTLNPATVAVPFANLASNISRDFDPVKRDNVSIQAALMSYVPVASRLNDPALDILGDAIPNRPFDWFVRSEQEGTPEARIYRAFASKGVAPTSIWAYKGKMEPDMFYDFTRERGAWLKSTLLANDAQLLATLEGMTPDAADALMENLSKSATMFARGRVGYIPEPAKR